MYRRLRIQGNRDGIGLAVVHLSDRHKKPKDATRHIRPGTRPLRPRKIAPISRSAISLVLIIIIHVKRANGRENQMSRPDYLLLSNLLQELHDLVERRPHRWSRGPALLHQNL